MRDPGLKESISLKEVLKEAKKMNPSFKLVEQLKFYNTIQVKIITFTADLNTSDTAFSKKQLAMLLVDGLETDFAWQFNQLGGVELRN